MWGIRKPVEEDPRREKEEQAGGRKQSDEPSSARTFAAFLLPIRKTARGKPISMNLFARAQSKTLKQSPLFHNHRRASFRATDRDIDELVEIRARQRTFDGAYIRTALGNLAYAAFILRVYSVEFAKGQLHP